MNYGDHISWSMIFAVAGPLFVLGFVVGWATASMIGSAFHGKSRKENKHE